jgi:hypothetical protein
LGHRATAIGGGAGRGREGGREGGREKDEDRGGSGGGGLPASKRKKNKRFRREELPIA